MQAAQGPLGQALVEIGDDARDVREPGAGVERRSALVVDEHERQVVGRRADREPGDEGPQQLALARAGGAGDEDVGTVADQVDLERAVGGDRQSCARPGIGAPGLPTPTHLLGSAAEGEQGRQGHGGRQPGAARGLLGVVPAGERQGHRASRRQRGAGREDVLRQVGSAGAVEGSRAVGSYLDDDVTEAGERRGRLRDDQRGAGPVGREQQLANRRVASRHRRRIVHDEQQVAPPRPIRPVRTGQRLGQLTSDHQPVTRGPDRGRGAASAASPAPASPPR